MHKDGVISKIVYRFNSKNGSIDRGLYVAGGCAPA